MLKRLDKWLNSLGDFSYDHPAFTTVAGVILTAGAMTALAFTLSLVCADANLAPSIKWEGDVTLEDTRRVHCIRFHDGGVSCDWSRADGSDNL